jgi:hypothetical protein
MMPNRRSDADQSVRRLQDKYIVLLGNNDIKPGQYFKLLVLI